MRVQPLRIAFSVVALAALMASAAHALAQTAGAAGSGTAGSPAASEAKSFDLSYKRSGHESAKPLLAFDDGRSLYLQFPAGREKPAIFAITYNGPQLLAVKEQGPYAVLEGLPQQLILVREDSAGQTYRAHVLYTGKRAGIAASVAPATYGAVAPAKEFATGKAAAGANAGMVVQIAGAVPPSVSPAQATQANTAKPPQSSGSDKMASKEGAASPATPLPRVGQGSVDQNYRTSNKGVVVTDNGLATRIRFVDDFEFTAHTIKIVSKEPDGDKLLAATRVGNDWVINGLYSNLALTWAESAQIVAVVYAGTNATNASAVTALAPPAPAPAPATPASQDNVALSPAPVVAAPVVAKVVLPPAPPPAFAEPERPHFSLELSDKRLSRALERWAQTIGKDLIWLPELDIPIQTRRSYTSDFLGSFDQVLDEVAKFSGKASMSYVMSQKTITVLSNTAD
jgi:Conjugal transfer protein/Toxin co-regulated pilus biosynthesis protein Q